MKLLLNHLDAQRAGGIYIYIYICVYVSFYVKLMTMCWHFDADAQSFLKTAAGSLSP